jgi:UDP-3-O-[3-hydroxymyristoyl] glucosamine N-acyltransferase
VTVAELIERLGGELAHGDPATAVTGVNEPSRAGAHELVFAETAPAAEKTSQSAAGAMVAPQGFSPSVDCPMAVVVAKQPRLWFAQAAKLIQSQTRVGFIHASAVVAPYTRTGEAVSIGPGAMINAGVSIGAFTRIDAGVVIGEDVQIGEHCWIHPRAVVYPKTEIGNRVIVHAGAVLGADGFGYVRDRETGSYTQFPQQGKLFIEDDVEIGANTTIDRGALTETRIRRGTKIDNLVHIGHNCDIGEDVVIAAQTGISGSSTVGKGAVIAGQVGIGDHAHVGPGVILGGQAGVLSGKTVETTGTVLWGTPAKPLREYLRELATLARLSRRKKD